MGTNYIYFCYLYTVEMAPKFPKQTLARKEETLDDYQGALTKQIRELLRVFGCTTNIPVKTMAYHDGRMLAKYRVSIQLPKKLGLYHDFYLWVKVEVT